MATASMGWVYADIEVVRVVDVILSQEDHLPEDRTRCLYPRSLVDLGATMLAIPEFVKIQLDLRPVREMKMELAGDSSSTFEVIGPSEVRFENRNTAVEALVVSDSTKIVLLV